MIVKVLDLQRLSPPYIPLLIIFRLEEWYIFANSYLQVIGAMALRNTTYTGTYLIGLNSIFTSVPMVV